MEQLNSKAAESQEVVDYVIVGAGFTGLSLAIHFEAKNITSYIVLESQDKLGGQLQFYQQKYIYDLPGILEITAADLTEYLEKNLKDINKIKLQCSMERIENHLGKKVVYYYDNNLKTNRQIICKTLILACGKGEIKPIKIPNQSIIALEKHEKVIYSLNEKNKYLGKVVAVFGGGDSAMDACNYLSSFCPKVYLIHRRSHYSAMPGKIVAMEKLKNIQQLKNYNLLEGNLTSDGELVQLRICNNQTKEEEIIMVDLVCVFYGLSEDDTVLKNLSIAKKIPVNRKNCHVIDHALVDFAIGDIASYENKRFLLHNYLAEVEKTLDYLSLTKQ
jgi:thioredoxin reductase (NADPH)